MHEQVIYSIIVPLYNEEKVIRGLLESVTKLKSKDTFELILVDGSSTDRSVAIIESFQGKIANLTVLDAGRSTIGAARKIGARVAKGSILVSSDADVSFPPDWLETLGRQFAKRKNNVGVVGIYRFGDKSRVFNFFFVNTMIFFDYVNRVISGTFGFRGLVTAVRRETYFAAGEYNENISALEDMELALRVKKLGNIQYATSWVVTTSYRRFEGRFIKQLVKRLKAYFFRVIMRNNEAEADWEVVR